MRILARPRLLRIDCTGSPLSAASGCIPDGCRTIAVRVEYSAVACFPAMLASPERMTTASPLPSFARPPVNEVVLSLAFDQPPGLGVAHLGDYWHRHLKADLPTIEEQPPYHRPFEILGPPSPLPMNVQLLERPPTPRLWAKSVDSTRLVQLQPDWFAFNWRDTSPADVTYPRWPSIEKAFLDQLHKLDTYLGAEGFGRIVARQCEVTYINQIRRGSVSWDHGKLDQVVTLIRAPHGFLPRPETSQLSTSYRIKDSDGVERGRLHVTVQPAFEKLDNEPLVILTLVARGEPIGPGDAGVLSFLRLGHEWVVRGFADLTTKQMHRQWERVT